MVYVWWKVSWIHSESSWISDPSFSFMNQVTFLIIHISHYTSHPASHHSYLLTFYPVASHPCEGIIPKLKDVVAESNRTRVTFSQKQNGSAGSIPRCPHIRNKPTTRVVFVTNNYFFWLCGALGTQDCQEYLNLNSWPIRVKPLVLAKTKPDELASPLALIRKNHLPWAGCSE